MDTRKEAKTAVVVVSSAAMALSLSFSPDFNAIGVYAGCGLWGRVLYSFFHVNIFHCILNVWCLLQLVFIYDIGVARLIVAYIVAVLVPIDTMGIVVHNLTVPTVGLSAVVFFLFGSISFEVERKWYYQAWMLAYLVVGLVIPNTNGWIHLYCYMVGIVLSLLNRPIKIKRYVNYGE